MKSIKFKLLLALLVGIILVLSLIVINNNRIGSIAKVNNQIVINNISNLANEYITYRVEKSNNIALLLSNNSNLNVIAQKVKVGIAEVNTSITILASEIMYQAELNEEIESIYIYIENENIFIDSYKNIELSNADKIEWVEQNTNDETYVRWVETNDSRFDELELISIIYRADHFNSNISSPVYVSINFEKKEFIELISRTKIAEETAVALVNYADNIFICDEELLSRMAIRRLAYDNKEYLKNMKEMKVDIVGIGEGNLVYTKLDAFDGAILHIIPNKYIEVISEFDKMLVLIIGGIILLGYLMSMVIFIKKNIDKPILKILTYMKKTGEGHFNDVIEEKRTDEFGQLYLAYNNMVREIERLIQKLYQEQLVKSELELKVLQEKINPHFLYNTLDTINWIARKNKIDEISKMVIDLSTMYRMTFNKGKDLITIKDMITGTSCYLAIQKIRYGDSFNFEFLIDEKLFDYEILNLIVQTIIENSIVHGMYNLDRAGKIRITGKIDDNLLVIIVEDNGVGLNKEKLDLINASINSDIISSESGLRNVQKRVKLFYGTKYGISIDSEYREGTKVTIILPYERKNI